jgi:hypothetical protein
MCFYRDTDRNRQKNPPSAAVEEVGPPRGHGFGGFDKRFKEGRLPILAVSYVSRTVPGKNTCYDPAHDVDGERP